MNAPRRLLLLMAVVTITASACAPPPEQIGAGAPAADPARASNDTTAAAAEAAGPDRTGAPSARPEGTVPSTAGGSAVGASNTTRSSANAAVATTRGKPPAPPRSGGGGRELQIIDIPGVRLEPTSGSKLPAGANKPSIEIHATAEPQAIQLGFTAKSGDPIVDVELRFPIHYLEPAKTNTARCVEQGAEYLCSLGTLKDGTRPTLDLQPLKGAKGTVTFLIEAIGADQTTYAGTFDVPLPQGS